MVLDNIMSNTMNVGDYPQRPFLHMQEGTVIVFTERNQYQKLSTSHM